MEFFLGLVLIALGVHMVIKTEIYLGFLGRNEWAEEHLISGGSRLLYKIIGLIFCFLGILGITGMLDSLAGGIASAVFGPRT